MCNHALRERSMLQYAASIVNGLVVPDNLPEYTPHAFPKSPSPVILEEGGRRVVQTHRWGVGYTVKGKPAFVTNARDDQLLKIRLWKESVSLRRCLIPLVAYFEPGPGPVGARGEIIFTMRDRPVFFVAGVWDTDTDGTRAYAMVTTSPNAYTVPFHDRQPVTLSNADALAWLGAQPLSIDRVVALTRPPPDEVMQHEVLPAVPRTKKDGGGLPPEKGPQDAGGQGMLF